MSDDWTKDHAAGAHQKEIASLMQKMEPAMHGHSRAIIIIALMRMFAAMLGPARQDTRTRILAELAGTIAKMLAELDTRMAELQREAKTASKQ